MEKYDESNIYTRCENGILEFVIKCNEDGDYYQVLYTLPWCTRTIEYDGILYQDDRFITLVSNPSICSELSKEALDKFIKAVIEFITIRGKLLDIESGDEYLNEFVNRNDTCEYVKDIDTLPFMGQINLDDEIMQKLCIERPVRKACKFLTSNGINTIMSSANKCNVESRNKPVDESKLYIGQGDPWVIGNGYAWIMLDWNELSDANKQYFINEVRNNSDFVKLYEYIDVPRDIALQYGYDHSKMINGLNINYQTGDDDYDDNKVILFGNNSLNNYDDAEHSRVKTVVLRYPVNETTKVNEVEEFFMDFSERIVKNNKQNKVKPIVELAFRKITEKGYFDIENGDIPIPEIWNEPMSSIPNTMSNYVDTCGYGNCFVFSACMMSILNKYGINSYMIGTMEDTKIKTAVMYEDGGEFYVANPAEDIEYFTSHNIRSEDRADYYDGDSATVCINENKHNNSRYTLDEFCEKYGTIWVIGNMNENSQDTLETQFASMESRTIMPPEKRNYDVKQLIKSK